MMAPVGRPRKGPRIHFQFDTYEQAEAVRSAAEADGVDQVDLIRGWIYDGLTKRERAARAAEKAAREREEAALANAEDSIAEAVASVVEGWYPPGTRMDWTDFLDRVEEYSGVDLGEDMLSPTIKRIKKLAKEMRAG